MESQLRSSLKEAAVETYKITSTRKMTPPLETPLTAATMVMMRKKVQIADVMHCMTRNATGESRCVQNNTTSTKSMRMVKAAKARLIAAPVLQRQRQYVTFHSQN